jgi:hypothetical protein
MRPMWAFGGRAANSLTLTYRNTCFAADGIPILRSARAVLGSSSIAHEAIGPTVKDQAALGLGRKGGKKGGRARAKSLSAKKRTAIARKAARARWKRPT